MNWPRSVTFAKGATALLWGPQLATWLIYYCPFAHGASVNLQLTISSLQTWEARLYAAAYFALRRNSDEASYHYFHSLGASASFSYSCLR